MKLDLIEKLKTKKATIGIVGLGYVGLPLMLRYCEVGYKVIGFDIDEAKIDILTRAESYIEHIPNERIKEAMRNFEPTSDLARVSEVEALIICVPTPLNKYREPDLSFVVDAVGIPYLVPA